MSLSMDIYYIVHALENKMDFLNFLAVYFEHIWYDFVVPGYFVRVVGNNCTSIAEGRGRKIVFNDTYVVCNRNDYGERVACRADVKSPQVSRENERCRTDVYAHSPCLPLPPEVHLHGIITPFRHIESV